MILMNKLNVNVKVNITVQVKINQEFRYDNGYYYIDIETHVSNWDNAEKEAKAIVDEHFKDFTDRTYEILKVAKVNVLSINKES